MSQTCDLDLDYYLEAVRYCAALGKKGPRHEPWVTNGEIIAGLEPPASSIRAIDWITSVEAMVTVFGHQFRRRAQAAARG